VLQKNPKKFFLTACVRPGPLGILSTFCAVLGRNADLAWAQTALCPQPLEVWDPALVLASVSVSTGAECEEEGQAWALQPPSVSSVPAACPSVGQQSGPSHLAPDVLTQVFTRPRAGTWPAMALGPGRATPTCVSV
jgi:hypothetical protein